MALLRAKNFIFEFYRNRITKRYMVSVNCINSTNFLLSDYDNKCLMNLDKKKIDRDLIFIENIS